MLASAKGFVPMAGKDLRYEIRIYRLLGTELPVFKCLRVLETIEWE